MNLHKIKWLVMLAVVSSGLAHAQAQSPARTPGRSIGQQLYLPIYSHIWHGDADNKGLPTRTLVSISVSINSAKQDFHPGRRIGRALTLTVPAGRRRL